jgi:hypothetical protein
MKGGPGAAPGSGPGAGGGGADMQKRAQEFMDKMRKATPAERKQMLQQVPAEMRQGAKERLKAQGIDIPD